MKKIFTILAVAFCALTASAKETLPDFTPKTMTFTSWSWNTVANLAQGSPTQVGTDKADDSEVVYFDASDYDFIVIEYSSATCATMQAIVQYNCDGTWGEWGANYNTQTVKVNPIPTGGAIGIELDADRSDKLAQIALQDPGSAGEMVITDAYFATEEEYKAALEGNKPTYASLTLSALGSGWGNSTYDGATHTITIGDDWSGKGWWLADVDYSDFEVLYIEFEEATAANGKVVIEYNDDTNNGDEGSFEAEATAVKCPLSAAKNSVKQIYIQGPAGTKYVLKSAMVCTNDYLNEYISTGITEAIAAPKAQNNVRYNLAGQRVGNGAKFYIMNGKKYMK